ncbi:hypothetical protein V6N13_089699 [Hibiscus sabdariffa]
MWIPNLGHLRDHALNPSIPTRYPDFTDLLTPLGSWDISVLSTIFPLNVAHRILGFRALDLSGVSDIRHWRWDHHFTVSSAYRKCMEHTWDPFPRIGQLSGLSRFHKDCESFYGLFLDRN